MSERTSTATGRRYTVAQICRVWKVPRSNVYFARQQQEAVREPARRPGPTGPCPDGELVERIRAVIQASPFLGEGYRKVWARLRHQGTRTSRERVRRLMRAHGLSAPYSAKRVVGPRKHDRKITTERPNEMWGMDATASMTKTEGAATIFIAVDHCTGECVGIHAAKHGTRVEALEPLRQGIREHFGKYEQNCARGLSIRHDHGSQYMSHLFQEELGFLGIRSTPAFVAQPECNGVSERFIRTLKEQLLWVETFETVEALCEALLAFKERYNRSWLVQKHAYLTPFEARQKLLGQALAA